jgi:hypothetical protein
LIVTQAEIDLVLNPSLRRRMMRLPASASPKARCPLTVGAVYTLQPRPFAPGQAQITVTDARREPLEALSLADARREGYAGVQGALAAFRRAHGVLPEQLVWVVGFVRGDESEFVLQDAPVYLSKYHDVTTIGAKQAVLGDPEMCIARGAAEHARVMRLATRQEPAVAAINRVGAEVGALREAMTSMKARNRAKLIERELAKLRAELPVQEHVRSPMAV